MADSLDHVHTDLELKVSVPLPHATLNTLFRAAWPGYAERDWAPILARSLTSICTFRGDALVGFVNVAWDGGGHAFVLDTAVHPSVQRRGLGTWLVQVAVREAETQGIQWLHVDYEPHLAGFYQACGSGLTNIERRP